MSWSLNRIGAAIVPLSSCAPLGSVRTPSGCTGAACLTVRWQLPSSGYSGCPTARILGADRSPRGARAAAPRLLRPGERAGDGIAGWVTSVAGREPTVGEAAGDDAARTGLATGLALTFVCLRRLPRRFAVVMPARVHRHGHHITNMRV